MKSGEWAGMHDRDRQAFPGGPLQGPSAEQLEAAHQRLLCYLKALQVPVMARYELATRALSLAGGDAPGDGDFTAAAMRSLDALLAESSVATFHQQLAGLQPMPPLNRGAMLPVVIDRSGPFAFFFHMLAGAAKRLVRPPLRRFFLLALLAALAWLYWWLRKG